MESDDSGSEQSMASFKNNDGYMFKGIVAAVPEEPRACGCVSPPLIVENVAPYSSIENVSVQRLAPEYKIGLEHLIKTKTPPMKASEIWHEKPAILLCIRRPGFIMCRAAAHQLYSKKPIFDALGVQLYAVLHEHIETEVKDFWPRYWGGVVLFDRGRVFQGFRWRDATQGQVHLWFLAQSESHCKSQASKSNWSGSKL